MQDSTNIIITLVITAGGWVGVVWKTLLEHQKNNKIFKDQFNGFENALSKLVYEFTEFRNNLRFERTLRNRFKIKSLSILRYAKINIEIQSMLLNFSKDLEELALSFWAFEDRHTPVLQSYIVKEINSMISYMENEAKHIYPNPKSIILSNGKNSWIEYTNLIINAGIYDKNNDSVNITSKLIAKLVENNLNNDSLIDLFENFIDDFFSKILLVTDIYENTKEQKHFIDEDGL